jgi:trk system potassium uptake protein
MRVVILGAGSIGLRTAQLLLGAGHEVIIIDRDKERLDAIATELDCGFVHGDGSKPAVLRDVDPGRCDALFCLSSNDQTNILASLVGRSLGFARVVTRIEDPELEHLCTELGLQETIIPTRAISHVLFDMAEGRDALELTTMIRDEARVLSFVLRQHDGKRIGELALPDATRVICFYRQGELCIPDEDTRLADGDEIVVIADVRNIPQLHEEWLLQPGDRSTHRPRTR